MRRWDQAAYILPLFGLLQPFCLLIILNSR
jgi:hypothetical protein